MKNEALLMSVCQNLQVKAEIIKDEHNHHNLILNSL